MSETKSWASSPRVTCCASLPSGFDRSSPDKTRVPVAASRWAGPEQRSVVASAASALFVRVAISCASRREHADLAMSQPAREHPYASFIHRVSKPSRYMGGEHGEVVKDWAGIDCSICLAFPDVYDVGMSHLGFKILYSIINGHPKLAAERAYAPWPDMETELRARSEPLR